MKILFLYPEYPDTFWSFKHALKIIQKKAALPPLGLTTVAAMLPASWEKKLIDMNVEKLKGKDILWADYIFISAMIVQRESMHTTIELCHALGKKVVAGGPLVSIEPEEFESVDYLLLNESENILPVFLADVVKGTIKHIYSSPERPVITEVPVPNWSLVKMNKYASMSIQYSRGCPNDCEFCNVVTLNGHKPRTKTKQQFIGELDVLYAHGWRGPVFIVDDNFIGNKKKLCRKYCLPLSIGVNTNGEPHRCSLK